MEQMRTQNINCRLRKEEILHVTTPQTNASNGNRKLPIVKAEVTKHRYSVLPLFTSAVSVSILHVRNSSKQQIQTLLVWNLVLISPIAL